MAMEILSPSYLHSPLVVYNLGGVELVLRLPQHNNEFEPTLASNDINIFDYDLYKEGFQPIPYLMLINTSWTYRFANSPIDAGSLTLGLAVTHCLDGQKLDYDFLNKESFAHWILDRLQQNYGALVEEEIQELKMNNLPILEDRMWQYPKKDSDLLFFEKCGAQWCIGKAGHPSIGELDPLIFVPINKNHALEISTSFSGFNPDFFDSVEAIEKIKEKLLQEFLEHMHITYPPGTRTS